MAHPWDRQPKESDVAYALFVKYRDLGEGRSMAAMDAESKPNGSRKKRVPGHIQDYCTKFQWPERAAAWDSHVQAELDKAALAERKKWEARRIRNNERNFDLGEQLRDRALALLKFPTSRQVIERQASDGTPQQVTIEPAKWTQRDIAVIAKTAMELAEAALADLGLTRDAEAVASAAGANPNPVQVIEVRQPAPLAPEEPAADPIDDDGGP